MAIPTTIEKRYGLPAMTGYGETLIRARTRRDVAIKTVFAAIEELPEDRRPFFAELAGRLAAQTSAAWWVADNQRENHDATSWLRTAKGL